MALTEIPSELSSTPSIVDNGNATAITIDSSENATFAGAISVTGNATIDGGATDNTVLTLDSGTANTYLKITDSNSTNGTFIGATTNDLNFYPNNSLAVTMTALGNVGIGVVPETWQSTIDALQVGLGASFAGNTVNPSRVYLSANYYINSSNQESYIATDEASQYFQNAGTHTFKVAPSGTADSAISWITAATIDNSGNLLVGQTTASSNTVGTSLRSDGRNFYCADGNYSGHFNRKSSDGAIVHFAMNDTIVGSIQSRGGGVSTIILDPRTNGVGLTGTATAVIPTSNTGVLTNAAMDIGASGYAFKDLYLSGGAYLGGTAAANKLDSYEEGAFTPTVTTSSGSISYGAQQGGYVKVGEVVHYWIRLVATCTATATLYNLSLPFSTSGYYGFFAGPTVGNAYNVTLGSGGTVLGGYYIHGDNAIRFHSYGSNTGQLAPSCSANQAFEIRMEGSYRLTA